jgi:hypothetical protein
MRLGVLVAVALLTLSSATVSAKGWSIDPPPGWQDITEGAADVPAIAAARAQLEAAGGEHELVVFAGPDGLVQIIYLTFSGKPEPAPLLNWEAGLRDSLAAAGTELSYQRRVDRDVVIVDERMRAQDGAVMYVRSMAGIPGPGRLVTLGVTCAAPEATCADVFASVTLDRTGFLPVGALGPSPPVKAVRDAQRSAQPLDIDERSGAYRAGALVGRLLVVGLLVGLVVTLVRKRRRKRPASPPPA